MKPVFEFGGYQTPSFQALLRDPGSEGGETRPPPVLRGGEALRGSEIIRFGALFTLAVPAPPETPARHLLPPLEPLAPSAPLIPVIHVMKKPGEGGSIPGPENIKEEPVEPLRGRRPKRRDFFEPVIRILWEWLRDFDREPQTEGLSPFHLELLIAIIKRKFSVKDPAGLEGVPSEHLPSYLKLGAQKPLKRTEENNKFVFKHTLKLMKQQFRKRLDRPIWTKELEEEFIRFYFADQREESFIFLAGKGKARSLSLSMLRKTFLAPKFTSDFLRFIQEPSIENSFLIQAYVASIPKKLTKLFRRWEAALSQDQNRAQNQVLEYFRTNSQCKLPWTVNEILLAVQSIFTILIPHETQPTYLTSSN